VNARDPMSNGDQIILAARDETVTTDVTGGLCRP
jgi:hypothetical protein